MSALETLSALYADPDAGVRDRRAAGARVVGCVGARAPRELVTAAGLLPVRLRGQGPPSVLAEDVLGPGVDPPVRRILAGLLEGTLTADFVLIGGDSDSNVRLFTSLRVLALDRALPELFFLDLLHVPARTSARYGLDRFRELRAVLARWSGSPVTDDAIREAAAEADESCRLLAALSKLRRASPPKLSGADSLAVIGAGASLSAPAYNEILAALLAETTDPLDNPRQRIYLTGSAHSSPEVYDALESDGSVVVGEDHSWGEPLSSVPALGDGDPVAALATRYLADPGPRAERVAREASASGADIVISWIRTGEDALAWELPALRAALAPTGIPLRVFEHRGLEAPRDADLAALA
ncbi:MAG TPA: 2-hydroxyacyl-CoA dehydratase family protein [Gaiellaceae bacterium]|jgi:benzoyl-CoA reductase/2-hydroxyglutaryl-CoA dehydratase subunit BcrC/BadD/HgdB|nr:2-hydroxyacyl-CoA dehydratase family protein [Gaiellaceae bacterium]